MAGRFSVEAIFKAVDRITAPVRRMQDRVRRFTESASNRLKDVNKIAERVTTGFRNVGVAAVAGAGIAAAALHNVIQVGAEFEQTLMGAVARFGNIQKGTQAFEDLRKAAEDVGATTEFDAQQAAAALNVYAAAGFNAQLAIASLAGAGDLATVSGLALDEAAKTAADSLGALGLRSSDAATQAANLTRLNDVLATTTRLANTSVTEMSEAIGAGGNIAISSGQSLETFGAMVASMANANIKGAEAGTAIRNTLAALQAPASTARRAIERLGVSVVDGEGNMRDIIDIVGDFQTATADMGNAARNEAVARIFGREGMGGFGALLSTGADGLRTMRTSLEGAQGAAANMAATMRDTTMGEIDGFTSAIDGVKTAIFGVISGPFRDMLKGLTDWVNASSSVITGGLRDYIASVSENIGTLAARAKGLAFIAGMLLGWAASVRMLTATVTALNFVLSLNPMAALAIAIIAAIGLIIAYWPEISGFFKRLWTTIQGIASRIGAWFAGVWASVVDAVGGAMASVGRALSGIWNSVKAFLTAAFEFYVGLLAMIWGPVLKFLRPVFDLLVAAAQWVISKWGPIKAFFLGVWEGVKSAALTAWNAIKSAALTVATAVRDAFVAAWTFIVDAATVIFERLKEVFTPIGQFFVDLWNGIAETFMSIVGTVIDKVSGVINAVRAVGRETLGEDGAEGGSSPSPQVVSPGDRVAQSISETTTTSRGEVTIRDETGRAEMTRAPRGNLTGVRLQSTGAF